MMPSVGVRIEVQKHHQNGEVCGSFLVSTQSNCVQNYLNLINILISQKITSNTPYTPLLTHYIGVIKSSFALRSRFNFLRNM